MTLKAVVSVFTTLFMAIQCKNQPNEGSNQLKLTVFLEEELPRSSPVVNLSALVRQSTPTSSEFFTVVQEGKLRFSFLEPNPHFVIDYSNPDAQILRIQTRVDRETVCPTPDFRCGMQLPTSDNVHAYGVTNPIGNACAIPVLLIAEAALMNMATKSRSQFILQLNIHIMDINDNAPSWKSFSTTLVSLQHVNSTSLVRNSISTSSNAVIPKLDLTVAEHTVIGTRLALPLAVDPDACPDNTTSTYGIESQTVTDAFVLDWDQTILDSSKTDDLGLWLRVNKDLNHDEQPYHHVVLYAADAGVSRRLTGQLLLNISVTDVNDHPPKFNQTRHVVWVREHEIIGSKIYLPHVYDADPSDRFRLEFALHPATVAATRSLFKVDPQNGEISVQGVIDFEQATQHLLYISVSDGKWTDKMELVVMVLNINDHAPQIKIFSHLASVPKSTGVFHTGTRNQAQAQLTVVVQENGPPNQLIATAMVTDKDFTAQLRSENELNSQHAELGSGQLLDEFSTVYSPGTTKLLKPVCSVDNEQFHMEALELDASQLSRDRFRFKIILAGKPLDREEQHRILLHVQCHDEDVISRIPQYLQYSPTSALHQSGLYMPVGRRSASASLLILVTDENDSPPILVSPPFVRLSENAPIDTLVMRIHATDADDPKSLAGASGLRYHLIGEPLIIPAKSATPMSTGVNMNELVSSGLASVDSFPSQPWFHLNPTTGDLKTLVSFDREMVQSITLQIEVNDGGDPSPIGSKPAGMQNADIIRNTVNGTVTIEIADVNDCVPTFSQQLYEFSLSEDSRPPVRIGRVNVTDCDMDENNHLLEFWLQSSIPSKHPESLSPDRLSGPKNPSGNSQLMSWFSVSKSGELFVRMPHFSPTGLVTSYGVNSDDYGPLDRERNEIIVLDVFARDLGSPALTGSAQILVRLTDVNDNAPEWEFPRPQNRLVNFSSEAAVGNRVARLVATDPDEGPRGKITYSILSGNEAGQFELDSESGWIYLAQPIDGQLRAPAPGMQLQGLKPHMWPSRSSSMIRLYVQASDQGNPPRTSSSVLDILIQQPSQSPAPSGASRSAARTEYSRHVKQPEYREIGTGSAASEIHSEVNAEPDRPTVGFFLSSDFLTLVSMITATLAALFLLFILFVVIRCRRLKQSQTTCSRRDLAPGAKWRSPEHRTLRKTAHNNNNVTDQQGHRLADIHPSDLLLYSTSSSVLSPCQTIPRSGLDPNLNGNDYSFLVHSNCPIESRSVCPSMVLNNSNHYRPQTFCPKNGEFDFQLLSSSSLPLAQGPQLQQCNDPQKSCLLNDGDHLDEKNESTDEKFVTNAVDDKDLQHSVYTSLNPNLNNPIPQPHSVCQSSSFV